MKIASSVPKVRITFYPMAGSVSEQFDNLLQTLKWVHANQPTPNEAYNWLKNKFGLSHYFARDVYTVLLISSGLVKVSNSKCYLTTDGKVIQATSSPITLLEVFEKSFAGVAAILEILRSHSNIQTIKLKAAWYELAKERFPKMKEWSKTTVNNQCGHRINWLRAMGFISSDSGRLSLSKSGWEFVYKHPPEGIAIQRHEIKKQEKQIDELVLTQFEPFDVSTEKAYSMRQVLVRDRAFRNIVSTQYEYHCAVCGFRLQAPRGVYEAEAAHIIPKRKHGSDDPRNGICLCGTCHWAFDEGLISVTPHNLSLIIASYLKEKTQDSSVQRYLKLINSSIRAVLNQKYSPSEEALIWHNENIFLEK
jgi:hypothetical protein